MVQTAPDYSPLFESGRQEQYGRSGVTVVTVVVVVVVVVVLDIDLHLHLSFVWWLACSTVDRQVGGSNLPCAGAV